MLGGGRAFVSWISKKQAKVTCSSTEAKYQSIVTTTQRDRGNVIIIDRVWGGSSIFVEDCIVVDLKPILISRGFQC